MKIGRGMPRPYSVVVLMFLSLLEMLSFQPEVE